MLTPALEIQSVTANQMLLTIEVSRRAADGLRADRLSTEDIVKTWMVVWKRLSGSPSVTITVKWQNVEIANGTTTIFSGDKVTIK